jgi:hypothetical protein
MAHAAGFEVNGGYFFGSYDDGIGDYEAPGFFFGARTNLTDLIGAQFNYQTVKVSDYDVSYSGFEILGSYRLFATDQYTVSVLGGWKTLTDETWNPDLEGSGIAIGAEVVAPFSDLVTVRGSLLLAPSVDFDYETSNASRFELAGTFNLPGLPVQAEAGYKYQSYKFSDDTSKLGGLFIGARTSF